MKNKNLHYPRVIEWSDDDDNCFVGTSPGLLLGGVHGNNPMDVAKHLEIAIQDAVELVGQSNQIPKPISTKDFSGKFVLRVPASLHQMLALRALAQGISLNLNPAIDRVDFGITSCNT